MCFCLLFLPHRPVDRLEYFLNRYIVQPALGALFNPPLQVGGFRGVLVLIIHILCHGFAQFHPFGEQVEDLPVNVLQALVGRHGPYFSDTRVRAQWRELAVSSSVWRRLRSVPSEAEVPDSGWDDGAGLLRNARDDASAAGEDVLRFQKDNVRRNEN